MVNPLAPAATSLSANLLPLEVERPVLPEPAVQVTAATQAKGANTAGSNGSNKQDQHPPSESPLEKALNELNGSMEAWSTGMRFDIDEDAQRVVVSIVDNTTGEVLRTVPSDAVVRIAKMIVQLQGKGISTTA